MSSPETSVPYPTDATAYCPFDKSEFRMWWNGGELDQNECPLCHRVFVGRHVSTVMDIYPAGSTYDDIR
jgi:hypothetical protein